MVNELNGKCHEIRLQLLLNESIKLNSLREERQTKADNIKLRGQLKDLTVQLQSLQNQQAANESMQKYNGNGNFFYLFLLILCHFYCVLFYICGISDSLHNSYANTLKLI